jgi:lysozyme family protein
MFEEETMTENFDKIMEFVFSWEGWKSDDPDDAGRRTVWGITGRDYPHDVELMWNMSKEESKEYAKNIFHRDYWNAVDGDNLEKGKDAFIMDTAVNMGKYFSYQLKQYELNDAFMERLHRYIQIAAQGNNIKFLRGWFRRVYGLYWFIKKEL